VATENPLNDQIALVCAAQAGDRAARDRLLTLFINPVRVQVHAKVPPDDADDVAQNVLLAALCGLSGLRHPERLAGWLHTIVRREIAHYHHCRAKSVSMGLLLWTLDAEDTSTEFGRAEDRDLIESLLATVPEHQRAALRLWEDDLTFAEIGARLGISRLAAEALFWRGRRSIGRQTTDSSFELPLN
jgi:RNA polymerase sigma factor (sigma-70 family)